MEISKNIPFNVYDLRKVSLEALPEVCAAYRTYLIDTILKIGGHFSANLGTVELTTALHYVLDTPNDQLVWDVGHQAYLHKIITGRKDEFETIRKRGGISGFPKRDESLFDPFGTGHSSTSISAVLGMAEADLLQGIHRQHIAVIGDGSLTGGMAWEALNNAAVSKTNILVVINDNQMGIDPNAGALNQYLNDLDKTSNFFTDLGFSYDYIQDGHDVKYLVEQLRTLVTQDGPKILHIKTIKGKGYQPAEEEQTKFHAVKYVKLPRQDTENQKIKYQDVFGHTLLELAKANDKVVGITPAMPSGCSMKILMDEMPDRCFDVGIAEQHAVTFSAGLAANGMIPFCNIYSTFLQRAYDQVIHDVCLQNLPVIFCLDRAGVVGEDGATHHGLYDMAYLRSIPNLTIMAPGNEHELRSMMHFAVDLKKPVAIRYPKGYGPQSNWKDEPIPIEHGKGRIITNADAKAMILGIGVGAYIGQSVSQGMMDLLKTVGIADMRFVKPLDIDLLHNAFERYSHIFTIEDGCLAGGFGSAVLEAASDYGYTGKIVRFGFPDEIIEHGTRKELFEQYLINVHYIMERILTHLPR